MRQRRRMPPDIRRRQILDTAVGIFYEIGFEGASLRDLAEKVGINKATLYHYFDSKEEILFQILDEVGQSLLGGLEEARRSSNDPLECLKAMIRFQIYYMEANLEGIKVLVEELKCLGNEMAEKVKEVQAQILKLYENVLADCMKTGRVRKLHLATAAFAILGQINWLYQWYKPEGSLSIRTVADEVMTIIFDGISPS